MHFAKNKDLYQKEYQRSFVEHLTLFQFPSSTHLFLLQLTHEQIKYLKTVTESQIFGCKNFNSTNVFFHQFFYSTFPALHFLFFYFCNNKHYKGYNMTFFFWNWNFQNQTQHTEARFWTQQYLFQHEKTQLIEQETEFDKVLHKKLKLVEHRKCLTTHLVLKTNYPSLLLEK